MHAPISLGQNLRFEYSLKFWVCSIFLGFLQLLGTLKMFLSVLKRWLKSLGLLEIFKYAWKSLSTLKILSMLEPNFEKADGLGISLCVWVSHITRNSHRSPTTFICARCGICLVHLLSQNLVQAYSIVSVYSNFFKHT